MFYSILASKLKQAAFYRPKLVWFINKTKICSVGGKYSNKSGKIAILTGLEIVMLSHTILFVENEGTYHIFFFIISCFSLHACLCSPFSHVLGMNELVAAVVALFTQKTSHIYKTDIAICL